MSKVPLRIVPTAEQKTKHKGPQFRQKRFHNDSGQISITINNHAGAVVNWSRTGIGFEFSNESAQFDFGERISGTKIKCEDILIYEGDIQIIRIKNLDDGRRFYGATFISNLFLVEGVHSALSVNDCERKIETIRKSVSEVNPEFCRTIIEFRMLLEQIEVLCKQEEERWKLLSFDQRVEAEKVFLPNLSRKIREALVVIDMRMAEEIDIESLGENSIYHQVVHEYIYPFFERSDLARRAFVKPRGYAGDYETMNQIYRTGYEGQDLFGRVLHNYITNEHSGESVRFRVPFLQTHIKDLFKKAGSISTLSVASGPCVEYQELLKSESPENIERLDMTLFDLDSEALEHAQTRIYEIAATRGFRPYVNFVNSSVKSFLVSSQQDTQTFDLIYSAGLFDYIDNVTSTALTHKFAEMLNPGGKLILGNFTKSNKTKAFLSLIAKWVLIHKSEQEILGWADGLQNCSVKVEYDPNEMFAFLIIEKNVSV